MFLTGNGNYVFASYNEKFIMSTRFLGNTEFTYKLEKCFKLKRTNIKANICFAHQMDMTNFKDIITSFGIKII